MLLSYSFKMASSDVIVSHRVPQDPNLVCVALQSLSDDGLNLQRDNLIWIFSNQVTKLIPQLGKKNIIKSQLSTKNSTWIHKLKNYRSLSKQLEVQQDRKIWFPVFFFQIWHKPGVFIFSPHLCMLVHVYEFPIFCNSADNPGFKLRKT